MKFYIHKKNKLYLKKGEVLNSDNLRTSVLYTSWYEDEDSFPFGTKWIRDKKEFEDPTRFRKARFWEVFLYIVAGKEVKF